MPCCRIFGGERVDHVSGGRDDERRPIRGGLAFETLSVAARKFDRQRVNTFPKSFACTFPKSILSRTGLHHVEGCRIYWSNTSTTSWCSLTPWKIGSEFSVYTGFSHSESQKWTVPLRPRIVQIRGQNAPGAAIRSREGRPFLLQVQLQAESGILTGSAGTNVATETCGHDRFLKFRFTVCEY